MAQPNSSSQDAFALLMSAGRKQTAGAKQQQQRKRNSTSASPQVKRQRSQTSAGTASAPQPIQTALQDGVSIGIEQQSQHEQHHKQLLPQQQQQQQQRLDPPQHDQAQDLQALVVSCSQPRQLHYAHATVQSPSAQRTADTTDTLADHAAATETPATANRQEAVAAFKRAFSGALSSARKPAAQKFDYLLVYDFEATCNKTRTLHPIEIMELSCVIVHTATASIMASYQSFVRPTEHPILDPFAVELCGIQQEQVDGAPLLADVLQHHHDWLQQQGVLAEGATCVPVTWTEWDLKVALCQECGWRRIQRPDYLCRWVDLKQHFKAKYKKAGNLRTCVEKAGLAWQGRAHSGIDDAVNTANLAIHLMRKGVQFEVTQVSENPLVSQQLQRQQSVQLGSQGRTLSAVAGVGSDSQAGLSTELGSPPSGTQGGEGAAMYGAAGSRSGGQGTPSKARVSMAQKAAQKGVSGVFDASGKWLGRCFCGTKAKSRVTKRPGANHGRQFWSCGCWTITAQQSSSCDFFMWEDDVPSGSLKGS